MPDFQSIEPAIDPGNRISFLLDWELTMKCNLDCSYCDTGIYGGHDNSTKHPPLTQCIDTVDFMFQYVDLYMSKKPKGIRYVILNVYGGESLHHPDIVTVLQYVRRVYQSQYQHKWHLTVTTTTNAIINQKKLSLIIPYIDEFTVSYHCENTARQKSLFRSNTKDIKASGKGVKCIILMHPENELFQEAKAMIEWCEQNQINFLPRQLDHSTRSTQFNYLSEQVVWFKEVYTKKGYRSQPPKISAVPAPTTDLSNVGRACCGGRSLCKDQDYKSREFFTENKFPDWFCSVNEFFLFIKQVNGEIYTNKDCKMNFTGAIGPIGNLNDTKTLMEFTKKHLEQGSMPTIQCKKYRCMCGLCAPKAQQQEVFHKIMEKYHI